MRIRQKIVVSQLLVLFVFAVIVAVGGYFIWLRGYILLEQQERLDNLGRIETAVTGQAYTLGEMVNDWAIWDDCYNFIANKDNSFAQKYLQTTSLTNMDMSVVAFYDNDKKMVEMVLRDRIQNDRKEYSEVLSNLLSDNQSFWQGGKNEQRIGIVYIDNLPIMVAVQPITRTNRLGGKAGWLLFGRAIDGEFIERLLSQARIKGMLLSAVDRPTDAMRKIVTDDKKMFQIHDTDNDNDAYLVITAVDGEQHFYNIDYAVKENAWKKMVAFIAVLVLAGIVITIVFYMISRKELLDKLKEIDKFVAGFSLENSRTVAPLRIEGHDELTELATIVNKSFEHITGLYNMLQGELTERKKAEHGLAQALQLVKKADKIKQEFLANISHEFRTPMNALIGMSDVLAMTCEEPEAAELAANIAQAAQALNILITDVLALTKQADEDKGNNFGYFSPREAVSTVKKALVSGDNKLLEVSEEYDGGVPDFIYSDAIRWRQIILNVLSNAIKFGLGKPIRITMKVVEETVEVNTFLHLTIKDNGMGMTDEVVDNIFEPFYQADGSSTRKFGGVGVGMTVVKRLVDDLCGKVEISSVIDEGTTVCIIIPFSEESTEETNNVE